MPSFQQLFSNRKRYPMNFKSGKLHVKDSDTSGLTEHVLTTEGAVNAFTGANTHTGDEAFSGSPTGIVVSKGVAFVEQAGTTLTGTIPIPAGSWLLEVQFVCTVLAGGTSASLIIGDDDDPDGWLTASDLKATDLLVGEVFSILNSGVGDTDAASWVQGTQGAYLTNAGRKGNVTASNSGTYYGQANNVIAIVTQGTPSTTGRYFMTALYATPTAIAAVVA